MRSGVSLRMLVTLSLWGLLATTAVLPSWYAFDKLQLALEAETKRQLIRELELVCLLLRQRSDFQDPQELQDWFKEVARPLEVRLTYVTAEGQVLADSEIPFEQLKDLEDFSGRPEIAQALHGGVGYMTRFSKTVRSEQVFAARSIQFSPKIPAGVVRLAASVKPVASLLDHLWKVLLLVFAAASVLVPLLALLLISRLKRSTHTMVEALDALGERDFGQRLYFSTADELYPLAHAFNRLAENTGSSFLALISEKQQLEAVFEAMSDGVMVLNARGRIVSINAALGALLDPHARPLGRRPLEVLMSLELQHACERILGLRSVPADVAQTQLTIVSGERTFEVSLVRLEDPDQKPGAVVVFHDLSRLKQLEKVRQDFVANVSHELRTPLTSIKGYTETLLAEPEPTPEVLASFLEVILKNTNHMAKMVDDLLQLARMEAHQEVFKPAAVNPTEALNTAWKACLPVAGEKQIRLENHLPQEALEVWADLHQLIRVFRNLLENAIRHSPEGDAITVACRTQGNTVTIGVANNGPSIPRHHQRRIFERFYRVEKSRTGDLGGTGLGLAICRHIMLRHGGLIWVESPNPGRENGATFCFTLLIPPTDGESGTE